jgi:peptidoglycan/LPS O-acetylase OafA/YrhL
VALFHSFHLLPVDGVRVHEKAVWALTSIDGLLMRLIMIPFNGGAAVSLFFVLSGFVLALSLRRDERGLALKGMAFAARRFVRIYPTLAIHVAIFAAAVLLIAKYFPSLQMAPPVPNDVIGNLLLTDFRINGATWSLMIELAAIPFLFLGHCVARRWSTCGLSMLVGYGVLTLFSRSFLFGKLIGEFVFMFFLGMLVAEIWMRRSKSFDARTSRIWFGVALAVLLSARFFLGEGTKWSFLVEGFASAAMIAALVLGPRLAVHDILETKPLRFLGRISYSFYLYHPLALGVFAAILALVVSPLWLEAHPFLGSATIAIVTVAVTIPLGYASYALTEKPMIRLSRRF